MQLISPLYRTKAIYCLGRGQSRSFPFDRGLQLMKELFREVLLAVRDEGGRFVYKMELAWIKRVFPYYR